MAHKRELAVAAMVLTAAAVIFTWPLVTHMSGAIPKGSEPSGVAYFQLFTAGWTGQVFFDHGSYWHAPFFYPFPGAFAWCEPQLFTSLLIVFLSKLAGMITAYNLVVLFFMVLMGLSGYSAARLLTEDRVAAIFSGLWLCAGAWPLQQIDSLPLMAAGFPFFFLVFLYMSAVRGRASYLGPAIACYLVAWFTCKQSAFALTLLLPFLFWPWLVKPRQSRNGLLLFSAGFILTAALVLPYALVQRELAGGMGFGRALAAVKGISNPLSLGLPARGHWLTRLGGLRAYSWDLGVIAVTVIVLALLFGFMKKEKNDRKKMIYGLLTAGAVAVCLGFGVSFAPYRFLFNHIPGFDQIRAPGRFIMFAVFAVAVLCAPAFAWLRFRLRGGAGRALTGVIFILLFAEMWTMPIPLSFPKEETAGHAEVVQWLARQERTAVMELPVMADNRDMEAGAMLRMLEHHQPVINGYASYAPLAYRQLKNALRNDFQGKGLRFLRGCGARFIVVHHHLLNERERLLYTALGDPVFEAPGHLIFSLPAVSTRLPLSLLPSAEFKAPELVPGRVYALQLIKPLDEALLLDFSAPYSLELIGNDGRKKVSLRGSLMLDKGAQKMYFKVVSTPIGAGEALALLTTPVSQ